LAVVDGDRAEQQRIGDAVADRVEEGPTRPCGARRLGHSTVEQVGHTGEHDEQQPEVPPTEADDDRSAHRHDQPRDGEVVGCDAGALDLLADRFELGLDLRTEVSVEHAVSPRGANSCKHSDPGVFCEA